MSTADGLSRALRGALAASLALVAIVCGPAVAQAADWSAASDMSAARYGHTATLLNNGKVLVTGGYGGAGTYHSSAELYDPATNTWSAAPPMSTSRTSHTATLLRNGKVLVTGGQVNNTWTASAEVYDPAANTWTAAPAMSAPRFAHTATLLDNGKVLVTAGSTGYADLTSAQLYDPATNTWSAASAVSTRRHSHTATLLSDGRVLVTGGFTDNGVNAIAEIYDPAANTWSVAAPMSRPRTVHTATRLSNGKVLVAGGNTVNANESAEVYDPVADTWSAAPPMNTVRYLHTATLLSNGTVLVTGGGTVLDGEPVTARSTEVYDPVANTWSAGPDMGIARSRHAATLLGDGRVLVTGGETNGLEPYTSDVTASAELYDRGATTLTVPAVVHVALVGVKINLPFTATLTRTSTGAPIAGKAVRFITGATPACNATTNTQGVASCTFTVSSLLSTVLGLGYSAVFDGDEQYTGSSGHGSLVG